MYFAYKSTTIIIKTNFNIMKNFTTVEINLATRILAEMCYETLNVPPSELKCRVSPGREYDLFNRYRQIIEFSGGVVPETMERMEFYKKFMNLDFDYALNIISTKNKEVRKTVAGMTILIITKHRYGYDSYRGFWCTYDEDKGLMDIIMNKFNLTYFDIFE